MTMHIIIEFTNSQWTIQDVYYLLGIISACIQLSNLYKRKQ